MHYVNIMFAGCASDSDNNSLECLLLLHNKLLDRIWKWQMGLLGRVKDNYQYLYLYFVKRSDVGCLQGNDSFTTQYIYSFYWSTLTLTTIGETPQPEQVGCDWWSSGHVTTILASDWLRRTRSTSSSRSTSCWACWSSPPSWATSAPWSPTWTRRGQTSGTRWTPSNRSGRDFNISSQWLRLENYLETYRKEMTYS